MDVLYALAELHAERSRLEEAILVLERLLSRQRTRRGRLPKSMAQAHDGRRTKTPKKRAASPRARKRIKVARRQRVADAKKAEVHS